MARKREATDLGPKAGWAEVDCTPPLGLPMGGRGTRFTPGREILDPLYLQALLLRDVKGKQLLLITIDMIGLSADMSTRFRGELAAQTGVSPAHIVLNFSHTHSGPMSGFEGYATHQRKPAEMIAYEEDLLEKACAAARSALADVQPVRVSCHRGQSHVGINRRGRTPEGDMGMRPNIDGHYNPELWVLDIEGHDGKRCVLFSYGCHPVIVYGYAWDGLSADFPGVCRGVLCEALGPKVQTQFIQGLAGNIRPRLLANLEKGCFEKGTAESTAAVGRILAEDVLRALQVENVHLDPDIRIASTWIMVERDQRAWPLSQWETMGQSEDEMQQALGQYWLGRYVEGPPPVCSTPWEVGLIQLAPGHRIAFFSGEALAEWLPQLRRWLADRDLVAWAYCQDGRCYRPTDAHLAEGGYEVVQSNFYNRSGPGPFRPGIDKKVERTFRELERAIKRECE